MKYESNQIYHMYNQGNNRQPIFFEDANYHYFLQKVKKYLLPVADILCYCLMPNHFHFLLVPNEEAITPGKLIKPRQMVLELQSTEALPFVLYERQQKISQAVGELLSSYTKAINKRYERSGSLFRSKTKIKDGAIEDVVALNGPYKQLFFRADNDYARQCFEYIHANPVKANLVASPVEWPYSSAKDFAHKRPGYICNQKLARKLLELS